MKKAEKIVRIILAVAMIMFGIVGFTGMMADPGFTGRAAEFFSSLYNSGYLMQSVYLVKIIGGLLMMLNTYRLIGLLTILPITTNIVTFHLFLDPSGVAFGGILFLMNIFLIYANMSNFKALILKTQS